MITFTLITSLAMLVTAGSCLKSSVDSAAADTGNVMIPSSHNFSSSSSLLEDLVNLKCQQYTAGLQDQVNELKAKVDRLEVDKNGKNLQNNDNSFIKGIKKRDIPKALQGICSTSSSLCTHYHPDHPDASRKKGTYSPTVTAEMLQNEQIISEIGIPIRSRNGSDGIPIQKEDLKNLNGKQKVNKSTSLTTRSGPPVEFVSRLNQLEAEFREKIEDFKTQTNKSIKDQNEKIAKVLGWEPKLAQLLNQSIEMIKELKTQNRDQSKKTDQLEQKVAMLQNTMSTRPTPTRGNVQGDMKNGASNNNGLVSKSSTPPSSCEELEMLDYYLDGLYLVKNKQTKKIQTVFCKFSADDKIVQELVGTVDIKKKTVHFYVQRNTSFGTAGSSAVILFEVARINEANAFNLTSGIFTIPVPGIYHFYFSAVKSSSDIFLGICLKVNGNTVGCAVTQQSAYSGSYDVVSLSASLRLAAGDRVNLYNDGGGVLFDNFYHYTHFSGWLVEEYVM